MKNTLIYLFLFFPFLDSTKKGVVQNLHNAFTDCQRTTVN